MEMYTEYLSESFVGMTFPEAAEYETRKHTDRETDRRTHTHTDKHIYTHVANH